MKKGTREGTESYIVNAQKGMPGEVCYLKHLVRPSPEDTGVGQAQSSEGQLLDSASLPWTSPFYACCSALFFSTETIHMAEHLQNLGLHEFFHGINKHCLQCCTAVCLPQSLSVTGSPEMPSVTMPIASLT